MFNNPCPNYRRNHTTKPSLLRQEVSKKITAIDRDGSDYGGDVIRIFCRRYLLLSL
jgi:hypothetical protein